MAAIMPRPPELACIQLDRMVSICCLPLVFLAFDLTSQEPDKWRPDRDRTSKAAAESCSASLQPLAPSCENEVG